jgi:hypothetical protein
MSVCRVSFCDKLIDFFQTPVSIEISEQAKVQWTVLKNTCSTIKKGSTVIIQSLYLTKIEGVSPNLTFRPCGVIESTLGRVGMIKGTYESASVASMVAAVACIQGIFSRSGEN